MLLLQRTRLRMSFASSWAAGNRSCVTAGLADVEAAQRIRGRPLCCAATPAGGRGSCHGRGLHGGRAGGCAAAVVLALCVQRQQQSAAACSDVG